METHVSSFVLVNRKCLGQQKETIGKQHQISVKWVRLMNLASVVTMVSGNRVEVSTFLSWGKSGIIGHKTEVDSSNSKVYVNFIWCKVCAKHKGRIENNPSLKGSAKTAALAFVNGTKTVTKYQVSYALFLSFENTSYGREVEHYVV